MTRVLVIPAAGRGSRLGWDGPKALCPIAGRPMIEIVLERYAALITRCVIVVAPSALPAFRRTITAPPVAIDYVEQAEPTGMLPAILCARPAIETCRPDEVWVTWCDQAGISATTVERLERDMADQPDAALIFPTVRQEPPYIHFVRDGRGRITGVLQRREGDFMPAVGESDAGLFAMRRHTFVGDLVEYDRLAPVSGGTRERNFLPFIPWLANRAPVRTIDLPDAREAVGVNTPADRLALEAYLGDCG